jgi:NitT/TauT family transport system substrate-binding protein
LTAWINGNLTQAKGILNKEIKKLTGQALAWDILDDAFARLRLTYDPVKDSLFTSARWAFEQGFLGKENPDLSGIYDLKILNEVLKEKNLPPVN